MAADTALSIATCTLPLWVLSSFSKATRKPWLSTTAMATGQPFLRASACPAAIAFFACSRLISGPYWGTCASARPARPMAVPAAAAEMTKPRRVTSCCMAQFLPVALGGPLWTMVAPSNLYAASRLVSPVRQPCAGNGPQARGGRRRGQWCLGQMSAGDDPLDRGPAARELLLQPLKAPIQVVDAVDGGLALRHQAGDDQRYGGPEIGGHHLRPAQGLHAPHCGRVTVQLDVGAESRELLHVHEAILEDGLADHAGAPGLGHQGHELRLQVGWEAWVG